MEPGPPDHKSLVLALSRAQDRLKALQKHHLAGLGDARCALEESLAAVLQQEQRLWARAREKRAQLLQRLEAVRGANEEAGQAGTARIQALQRRLSAFHTRLLASPGARFSAEMAQEAADLLARTTSLALKLTWAHFVPQRAAPALGELHLEEQALSLPPSHSPASTEGGQSSSSRPQETGEGAQPGSGSPRADHGVCCPSEPLPPGGAPPLEAGLACRWEKGSEGKGDPPATGGKGLGPGETGMEAESASGARPAAGRPTAFSGAGQMPARGLLVAERADAAVAAGPSPPAPERTLGGAPGSLPHEPGSLFHARAVWVQEDGLGSSSREVGGSGHCRDVAVLGSRVPSAEEPFFPRWASADSLARPRGATQGAGIRLGGSCMDLAERAASPGGAWHREPAPAAAPSQQQGAALLPGAPPGPPKWPAIRRSRALPPRILRAPPPPCDRLVARWGRWGGGRGQLCLPHGLSAGQSGSLYVVDCGNRRLQQLGGARLELPLRGKAHFDVAQGRGGCLALTNSTWRCVELYSASGALLQAMSEGFQQPRGIAANAHGEFLVADTRLGALHVLAAASLASADPLWRREVVPGFHKPYLVATNSRGEVAVSERGLDGGCCVKVLGPTWQVLRTLGGPGSPPLLTNPWGVALDEAGRVLVADWGRRSHTVLCYPCRGRGWAVATQGLSSPRGVALLGGRRLVVADSMHHCLKSFQYC